jgi:hypothetical protein
MYNHSVYYLAVGRVMKLLLILLAATLAPALRADMLYDNIAASSRGIDCANSSVATSGSCLQFVSFSSGLYDSFSTPSVAERIIDLRLRLNGNPASAGAVDIGLYADSATNPGAFIIKLGEVSDGSLTPSLATYNVTLTANPLLAPSRRYWIGLTGATTAGWSWSLDISGPGVSGEFYSNPSGTFPSSNGPYQMALTGQAVAVPEPAAGLLLAVLLAWIVMVYRCAFRPRKGSGKSGGPEELLLSGGDVQPI